MNFWNQLETKQISKNQVEEQLLNLFGQPTNQIQTNLYQEIVKKIHSYYYSEEQPTNFTTYSLIGFTNEIMEKKFKEGKNKGQTYYILTLGEPKERLQVLKENLPAKKWSQIEKLAILGQNLVFKYKKLLISNYWTSIQLIKAVNKMVRGMIKTLSLKGKIKPRQSFNGDRGKDGQLLYHFFLRRITIFSSFFSLSPIRIQCPYTREKFVSN